MQADTRHFSPTPHHAALRVPERLRQAAAQLCPRLWRQVEAGAAVTVAAHAEGLWRRAAEVGMPRHPLLRRARQGLRAALAGQLGRHREVDAAAALAQFDRYPLLQTSDHAQLVLDPVTFYTNLVFAMGARRCGARFLFINACSTITLETRARSGPGWLAADGGRINLFGLPRRRLARSSVCAPSGPVRFALQGEGAAEVDWLRRRLPTAAFGSPAEAFEAANACLWPHLDGADRSTLAYTDDRLTAAAVAYNLTEPDGILFRLLFEPALRCRFLSALARRRQGVGRLALPATAQLFWAVRGGRVRPLRLEDGWLQEPGGTGCRFRLDPAAVIAGLRAGELFPDLCLGFLAIAILPRVMVTGGSSQAGLYPADRRGAARGSGGGFRISPPQVMRSPRGRRMAGWPA